MGEAFVQLVGLLLNNFQSCVMNNGHLSGWFQVSRSCHQGCPATPSLMILCAEAMAHTFKQNLLITPYHVAPTNTQELISQFADDTQLFTQDDKDSLEGVIVTFDVLRDNIGFTVNYEKSTIHKLGSAITVTDCSTSPSSSQIYDILDKAKKVLNSWAN